MHGGFLKNITKIVLVAVIATNVFSAVMFSNPEGAEAYVGSKASALNPAAIGLNTTAATFAVPSYQIFDQQKLLDGIFENIMIGIAYAFSQYFMQRFVSKLVDKYKIRNFLYYDQILSNYYLTNFIRDKIADPDLREIYILLESEFVLGQPNGTTPGSSGIDPRQALVPRIKRAITNLYIEETGIDPVAVAYPPPTMTARDYLYNARAYYINNIGYTESNLRAQFGEFQSNATTASQLEVLVGNSLKAGRFIGGTCDIANIREPDVDNGSQDEDLPTASEINTPASCTANGGTWEQPAIDKVRSFIDNPSGYVDKWMQAVVKDLSGSNFDPNNFWFVIGNAFGRYLVNNLLIDKPGGVLNEDPNGYDPSEGNLGEGVTANAEGLDLDEDGVTDGFDNDGDGEIDYCVFGGTPPDCTLSGTVTGQEPEGVPPPSDAYARHGDPEPRTNQVAAIINEMVALGWVWDDPNCDRWEVTMRVAWALRDEGAGLLSKDGTNCNGFSVDAIIFDDGYVFDILGDFIGPGLPPRPQWISVGCPGGQTATCPERWVEPRSPIPTCPRGHHYDNMLFYLGELLDEVSRWDIATARTVSDTGINAMTLGVNGVSGQLQDILENQYANDQFRDRLAVVIGHVSAIFPLFLDINSNGRQDPPLDGFMVEGNHNLTQSEKDDLNSIRDAIIQSTNDLMIDVSAECN